MRDIGIRAAENVLLVWAQPSTPTTLKLSAEGMARYQQRQRLDYGSPPTEQPPLTGFMCSSQESHCPQLRDFSSIS